MIDKPINFDVIFNTYKERVYAYALKIVKSAETAQEVTQEVMVKLWLTRETLTQVDNLDAFIFVIARNKSLDHLRKAAYDIRLLDVLKAQMNEEVNNVADWMMTKDYEIIVNEAIEMLSPQRKKVYQLSRLEGLNHDEIADRLQLSRNTVKNHLVESLRTIRLHLYKTSGIMQTAIFIYLTTDIFFHNH